MKTQESSEMYLETILILSKRLSFVRSIDIANELGYSKPSVSVAMRLLRESGDILVDKKGYITLTVQGQAVAEAIYERHTVISEWLTEIGVTAKTAAEDACRIEHVITDETFGKLKEYIKRNN